MSFIAKNTPLPVEFERSAFDFEKIFLSNQNGQVNTELASQYSGDYGKFEDAMKGDTIEAFEDVDVNSNTPKTLEKIDFIAVTMLEKIKRTVKLYDPTKLIYDVRSGVLGKTLEAHEVYGGKVYNFSYGGTRNVSSLVHKTYTITSTPASVHFAVPVQMMKTGRVTLADMTLAAAQAILAFKVRLGFDTFVTAYTAGDSYTTNASSADITKTVLNGAIDDVADRDVSNIKVIGRYSKLTPITDFTGFSDKAAEEIRMKGGLGKYRGADIIKLKYWADMRYATVPWDTTSIILASDVMNYNRYVNVTGLEKFSWIDQQYGMFHFKIEFEDGAAIWKEQYGHRIYNV